MGSKRTHRFNAPAILERGGLAKRVVEYQRGEIIFSQGDASENVMYLQEGGVKLSVASKTGREAVMAMLGPGDFFGEECLAGQTARKGSATAVTQSTVLAIRKDQMVRLLHTQPEWADRFITHLLGTTIRIEQDLIAHVFNSTEKRLARALLRLARYGQQDRPQRVLPQMSPLALAKMVGATSASVDFFMKKFQRLGFIKDDGVLEINRSLLSVVLHE
jgi:CRP-like cAMP-binding protein